MKKPQMMRLALLWGFVCGTVAMAATPPAAEFAVEVSATVQTSPEALITLSWPADSQATGYTVYRKALSDTAWGSSVATLAADASGYIDSGVAVGGAYEYRIDKSFSFYVGSGFIYAGIQAPLVESRGKAILIVDNTFSVSLANELARLTQDLAGDGWVVLRHDVPRELADPANTSSSIWATRANELASLKSLIETDYNADPGNVKALFLFGHVPVPYSGDFDPDGHGLHFGAWPADVFYGDMSGAWGDSVVNDMGASDTRNWNVPGDGKFDPTKLPASVQLEVGRVDMANLPSFSQTEEQLLQRYLNKDHNFRNGLITAQRQGFIDDHFGYSSTGEPFAVNGWRNFAAFFGADNVVSNSDWFDTLDSNSYLWGYGCGAGSFTSCSGVGSTTDFVGNDPQVVFTMFFGSDFGDWDSQDNFLRAALGTATYTLTSAWAGRPNWICHHMGLGETIGFAARLTQNNIGLYDTGLEDNEVHIALMGDPTLRMHVVAPPSALVVTNNTLGGVALSWTASTDGTVLGYNVYRAATAAGPFTRVNGALVSGTTYTDPGVNSNVWYMVRAVKLESSGSGTYYNASQGIFQNLDVTWTGGSTVRVDLDDATGTAGSDPGWTLFDILGDLTVQATAENPITIQLVSLSGGLPGQAAHFDYQTSYFWEFANIGGVLNNFDPTAFVVDSTQFQNPLDGGTFQVIQGGSGNPQLVLEFEPHACDLSETSKSYAVVGGNMQMYFTNQYGLAAVEAITLVNCTITAGTAYGPGFESGDSLSSSDLTTLNTLNDKTALPNPTTNLVLVAAKIVSGSGNALVNARVFDGGGCPTQFDPFIANLMAQAGAPLWQTYSGVPSAEHYVTLANGTPGLRSVKLLVNGWTYNVGTLADGQAVVVDVVASMNPGANNTILILANGAPGASANVVVSDTASTPALSVQPQIQAPLLSFVQDGGTVILSWPAPAGFFTPQGLDSLGPAASWQDLAVTQEESQGWSRVTIQTGAACQLFRLRK